VEINLAQGCAACLPRIFICTYIHIIYMNDTHGTPASNVPHVEKMPIGIIYPSFPITWTFDPRVPIISSLSKPNRLSTTLYLGAHLRGHQFINVNRVHYSPRPSDVTANTKSQLHPRYGLTARSDNIIAPTYYYVRICCIFSRRDERVLF